jgi:hypothetical protein
LPGELSASKEELAEKLKNTISLTNFNVTPLFSEVWKNIHPSIDVLDGVAYVGVNLPCEVKDDKGKVDIREFHFLVNSKAERILCHKEQLSKLKLQLRHSVVKLPNRWSLSSVKTWLNREASVNPEELYVAIKTAFQNYIEFEESIIYDFLTLWTIGTYFYHLFNAYPYIYVFGMKRTGKTKLLTLLSLLCHNAIFSNNISTASVFRLIQSGRCTLLMDETEKLANPERETDFRNLLLSGYKKGALVYRTHKDTLKPEPFEVYSPKVIANIKGIEDILEDRCIILIMKRGKDKTILNNEPQSSLQVWQNIRDMLYIFYLSYFHEVSELSEQVNLVGELLSERNFELWKPILTMAKFFDGYFKGLYDKILDFAQKKTEEKNIENITEVGEYILVQTLTSLVKEAQYYKIKEIKELMAKNFDEEQKWLNTRWIGKALRRLGFTQKRRVGTGYEYLLTPSQVEDLAERLGIESSKSTSTSKFTNSLSSLNASIPEIYAELRKQLKEPFDEGKAISLIVKLRQCDYTEAEKIFQIFQDEGKVFLNPYGLWEWAK